MYDIHTHLYWQSYDEDREAVLARAREALRKRTFIVLQYT
jgi:Tat protein secretion system quality control protein TatD with DNase activity